MNVLMLIFSIFSIIGILDAITGNHFGLGEEFEKGIKLVGALTLSMLGMICLVPLIKTFISPAIIPLSSFLHIDPSIFSAMLVANDMGGAALSSELALDGSIGLFNATVVSSMMGVTISFTLPTVLKTTPESSHKYVILGLLSGVSTIPVGCFVSGLMLKLHPIALIVDLIPLLIFSTVIILGLIKAPRVSVKIVSVFGKILFALIMLGLGLAILEAMTGYTPIKGLAPASESYEMLFKLAFMLSGVFPLISILSRLLKKPLGLLSKKTGLDETSSLGLLTSLASSIPTFGLVEKMAPRGIVINMAFAVSAAFALGDHLAFTAMFAPPYAAAVVVGKLISGISAIAVAYFVSRKIN
ncbi:MAG: ethanolamine utilization protein EutH [Clostridia bacterium]|nr:ethanolamine utilization protein EutH [Clostridia bacterium]